MAADPWTPERTTRPRIRRPRSWTQRLAVGGAVLAVLVVLTVIAVATSSWFVAPGQEATADEAQRLQTVEKRLAPVVKDFDQVVLPSSVVTSALPATLEPCVTDSGDVIEPQAVRVWDLAAGAAGSDGFTAGPTGRAAAASVAEQLRSRGWTGGDSLTEVGQAQLTKRGDGYTMTASVDAYGDAIYLHAEGPPLSVCD